MKRYYSILFLAIVLFISGCSNKSTSDGKINVTTSVYPIYDFTKKIGGDKVNVSRVVPNGIEAHDWEPEAADIVNISKSDLFIYNGAGLEHWVDDVLSGKNDVKIVEAARDVKLLNSKQVYDPHTWLDPNNVKIEMNAIKNALIEIDKTNKNYYVNNYNEQIKQLDALDNEYKKALNLLSKKDIVVSHEAFGYLCKAYGLRQHAVSGLDPNVEPDSAKISEIIKFVKANKVNTIFFEEKANSKVADTISKETNASTAILSPLESISNEDDDYYSVMRDNLKALVNALK